MKHSILLKTLLKTKQFLGFMFILSVDTIYKRLVSNFLLLFYVAIVTNGNVDVMVHCFIQKVSVAIEVYFAFSNNILNYRKIGDSKLLKSNNKAKKESN